MIVILDKFKETDTIHLNQTYIVRIKNEGDMMGNFAYKENLLTKNIMLVFYPNAFGVDCQFHHSIKDITHYKRVEIKENAE